MASTIQLKSGTGSAVPSALAQGEIAMNVDNGLFYYGSGSGRAVKQLDSFTHITSSGNISSSGNAFIGTPGNRNELHVYGRIYTHGSEVVIGDGHISMSGNIVMTGSISGSSTTTASFAHIITEGDTIEFKSGGTKLGSIKFDASDGLKTEDAAGNSGKIKTSHVTAIDEFYSPVKSVLAGPVTASIISSSTEVITPTLKGGGNTTGLIVAGYADIQGNLTASGEISASGTIYTPKLRVSKSPPVTIENGHITASGNISASANVYGLTGSFGTGTTHVHDSIQTAGYISSSDEFIGKTATFSQRIKVKGSDITLEGGHISASGNISGSLIKGLTGSFGTGTTTITDKITTGGDIESTLGTIRVKNVIATGKIQGKGSDVTIENGHISMSGNMIMTGSLTAGGDVTAGTNGTGSFDHIITLDDTIEFRNKADRNQVKGYMKFDPEKGLIHLSGSGANAVNTLQSIKIKPTDFYPIGVAVGGKGAGGVVTLQPKNGNSMVIASAAGVYTCEVKIPKGLTPGNTVIYGSDTSNTYKIYAGTLANNNTATDITPAVNNIAVGTIANGNTMMDKASKAGITWNSNNHYLIIEVTTNGADGIYGGYVLIS